MKDTVGRLAATVLMEQIGENADDAAFRAGDETGTA